MHLSPTPPLLTRLKIAKKFGRGEFLTRSRHPEAFDTVNRLCREVGKTFDPEDKREVHIFVAANREFLCTAALRKDLKDLIVVSESFLRALDPKSLEYALVQLHELEHLGPGQKEAYEARRQLGPFEMETAKPS